jgi:site-specific DNA recombinase
MIVTTTRRVAFYERVSSEDQKERATILTQKDALNQKLKAEPTASLIFRYTDDGISGTIPMSNRPSGKQLLRDADNHLFDELWVYNLSRLGRNKVDLLLLQQRFEDLHIKIISLQEGELAGIPFDVSAILADYARKHWLKLSADGMKRAASEGRYTGGIVPIGYKKVGQKQTARLELSDDPLWINLTEVDAVRRIYNHLAVDGWSCFRIAKEFNSLGIPTDYVHDNRQVLIKGQRKDHTQGVWRAGRIRNIVVNPVYKGLSQYGRRSTKPEREIIQAKIPSIVSEEVWQAAQEALAHNRIAAKHTKRHYLLTGKIKCGDCGKTYCAVRGRGETHWWRCNGRMTSRAGANGVCKNKGIKSTLIEQVVWQDIERWLYDPGKLLKELQGEINQGEAAKIQETDRTILEGRLKELDRDEDGFHRQNAKGMLSDTKLRKYLREISESRATIEKQLDELLQKEIAQEPLPNDLLQELRDCLDNGLTDEKRQEVVKWLVNKITIRNKTENNIKKSIAEIEYRFQDGVVSNYTDKDSSHPPS